MTFLYKSQPGRGEIWARVFAARAPEVGFRIWPDVGDPAEVRYLAAWTLPPEAAELFPNLEVLFCVGAGIDQLDLSAVPEAVAVVRMIEPGLERGMVEYVALSVLAVHRDWVAYAAQQREQAWRPLPVRPAATRRIGVMGMGVLGRAVLGNLRGFGFPCAGWSRTPQHMEGVECYAGADSLRAFLERSDIVVCLLPLTEGTRGILDRRAFDAMPEGSALINVGRGGHLDQDDLLRALDAGRISVAILDVADPEPLPSGHPLWAHPRVVVTPHIASETQPESSVEVVLENLRRHRGGEPMIGVVDRRRGY